MAPSIGRYVQPPTNSSWDAAKHSEVISQYRIFIVFLIYFFSSSAVSSNINESANMVGIHEAAPVSHAPPHANPAPVHVCVEEEAMDQNDDIQVDTGIPNANALDCSNEKEIPMDSLQSSFGRVNIYEERNLPDDVVADNYLVPKNGQESGQSTSPCSFSTSKIEMSMIRDLWNGSLGDKTSRSESIVSDNDEHTYFNKTPNDAGGGDNSMPGKIVIYMDDEEQEHDDEDKENW